MISQATRRSLDVTGEPDAAASLAQFGARPRNLVIAGVEQTSSKASVMADILM